MKEMSSRDVTDVSIALSNEGLTIPQKESLVVHYTRRDCHAATARRSGTNVGKWCVPELGLLRLVLVRFVMVTTL